MEDQNSRTADGALEETMTAQEYSTGADAPASGPAPTGYRVTLLSSTGRMHSRWIPLPAKGRYALTDAEEGMSGREVWLVEKRGQWEARCGESAVFMDAAGAGFHAFRITDQCLVQFRAGRVSGAVFAELTYAGSMLFRNYRPLGTAEITIGKLPENDIVCSGRLVSRRHASLLYSGGIWRVEDRNSRNGVYVNGFRVRERELHLGDEVYILGLRILIGCGFLSVNEGSGRVTVRTDKLERVLSTAPLTGGRSAALPGGRKGALLYNRLPRRRTAAEFKDIELEAPPMSLDGDKIPLLLRMGSPMTMGVSSLMYGNYMMLLSSLLFPMMTQRYTEKQKKEYEDRRRLRYGDYLKRKRDEIRREKGLEERTLRANYPDMDQVLHYVEGGRQLWERRDTDDDYLMIRLGHGDLPMHAGIQAPAQHFVLEEDALDLQMHELAQTAVELEDVPVTVDLKEDKVIGVTGDREASLLFIRQMIMRLAILYSYDEMKLVFLAEEKDLQGFEFVRYLPHTWDDVRSMRFLAATDSEAYQIGEFLRASVDKDLEEPRDLKKILRQRPYYVVIALSKRIFDGIEAMKGIMAQEKNIGISVIAVYDNLPKECTLLLDVQPNGACSLLDLRRPEQAELAFRRDFCDELQAAYSMKELANTRLRLISQTYALPKALTFLEMFGVGRVEHLNPAARWRDSNPISTLAAPVGVAADGSVFMLDLHQKFQGPHGLVAGMTGSGKSEFLITYILSMAINYHPDEVAFVLIDYKGGGLAGAFDDPARRIHLPHLVGTITNLDGAAIQRSMISLESELKRRQRVFNEARSLSGEGTMDIYTYQRLVRRGIVKEPVPHLFIISDEFAELKSQQPEFMDQLISTARIGRSLGVHLILATQKPSGVVNEQIRSNTKFQVCLKVQDRMDSMDMINRPDAAELKETGRFYLQVGYNEFFAMGQSGWSGADYEPQDEVIVNRDDSIQVIDLVGQNVAEIKPKREKGAAQGSQLVAVVRYLSALAVEQGLPQRTLWKEPLPAGIDADALRAETEQAVRSDGNASGEPTVTFTVGMLDDPSRQVQFPLVMDLVKTGHLLIIGEQGSGKSVLLQSMLLSLADRYSPQQVQFYMLDYSGRMLGLFRSLPHCGAVLNEESEDSLKSFFELLDQIVADRKRLFASLEADSYETAARQVELPLVLVVIDNVAGLMSSQKGYEYYSKLDTYLKAGAACGLRYIITMSHLNEMSSRIRQELPGRLALHMKDKYEYAEALDCRCNCTPPEKKGRGLAVWQEEPLEFQAAMYFPFEEEKERVGKIKDRLQHIALQCPGQAGARRLPVITDGETYETFAASFGAGRIPLGYSLKDARSVALPLRQLQALSLYFGNPAGIAPVIGNFLYAAGREGMDIRVMKRPSGSVFSADRGGLYAAEGGDMPPLPEGIVLQETDGESIDALIKDISPELVERSTLLGGYCAEHGLNMNSPEIIGETYAYMRSQVRPILLLLEGYADLCRLAEDGEEQQLNRLAALFSLAARLQIYVIACMYPGDDQKLSGCELINYFNPERLAMLFGGRLDRQPVLGLPSEYAQNRKPARYDRCLMHYREGFYALQMPCGELRKDETDADSLSIFGQE